MNTKNKIIAILMVSIVAMAVGVPMAMGDAVSKATVGNKAPVVNSVTAPDPAAMNLCPATTAIVVTASVTDLNGIDDITSVKIVDISPKPAGQTLTPINMSTGGSGTTATYTATVNLPCCTANGTTYTLKVEATDDANEKHNNTDTFTVPVSTGISMNFNKVLFSGLPGQDNRNDTTKMNTTTVAAKVKSLGNTVIDVGVNATDLTNASDSIPGNEMSAKIGTAAWQDNLGTKKTFDVNITCNTTADADFILDIPTGTPLGEYAGTIVISKE